MQSQQPGYILVLTLMLLGAMVVIVIGLSNKAINQQYFDALNIERIKAQQLAYGGISLAMNQLMLDEASTGTGEQNTEITATKKEEKDPKKAFIINVVPYLNQWQSFELKEKVDGIDGHVHICISCEDGKLNLNKLYNYEEHVYNKIGDGSIPGQQSIKTFFSSLRKFIKEKDLFEPLERFLKQRDYPIDDATVLLTDKDFQQGFKTTVFFNPSITQKVQKKEPKTVYLTDIITAFSSQITLNPWFLSSSIAAVFGLEKTSSDPKIIKKQLQDILKETKPDDALETVWNSALSKLYSKEFKTITKDLIPLLDTKVQPKNFAVLSRGVVGRASQKILALIEREESNVFLVKKLYWL